MTRPDDPVADIWHALARSAGAAGCPLLPRDAHATPWWSATFAGHRVELVALADPATPLDAWLVALAEAELPLPGRLVADCTVDARRAADGGTVIVATLLVLDAD